MSRKCLSIAASGGSSGTASRTFAIAVKIGSIDSRIGGIAAKIAEIGVAREDPPVQRAGSSGSSPVFVSAARQSAPVSERRNARAPSALLADVATAAT
jgi:hypothetical protein